MSKEKNNAKNKFMKYVIEAIVLLAIGVAAFYGISKINPSVMQTNHKTVTITFEAQNVEEDILQNIAVGDWVCDNVKNTSLGTIQSLSEPRPATRTVADYEKQQFTQAPVEGFYVQDIVVQTTADVTDLTVMAGETELKIGYSVPLINEKYLVNCIVTDITIAE